MIIKYKEVNFADFALLMAYLSYNEGAGNQLRVSDVQLPTGLIADPDERDGEQFALLINGHVYDQGYVRFAKLLSAKHSYNDLSDLEWSVEIEIPDSVHVAVIDTTGQVLRSTLPILPKGCFVTSGRILLAIHDIVRGTTRTREAELADLKEWRIVTSPSGPDHWVAHLVGETTKTGKGVTQDEAIGNLIRCWPELFKMPVFQQ